ncbi:MULTISPECIES: hypothetical protein [Bradyrhizobium]|nr:MULTISPECIES: hypothetical protein [Bradyrhizobium]WOH55995.1 hypothetical protein RX329_27385 [Bradyrhizobium sp. BWC-3-1]
MLDTVSASSETGKFGSRAIEELESDLQGDEGTDGRRKRGQNG